MALRRFSTHYDYGESLTVFAALKAGGFHPTFHAFEHTSVAIAYIDAFGGMQISLPEQEFQPAKDWLIYLYDNPITDFDPIERRPFGKWKRGTLMTTGPDIIPWLPVFFIPPVALLILTIFGILLYIIFIPEYYLLSLSFLFFPLLLIHAKYIAGPKFVKEKNVPSR